MKKFVVAIMLALIPTMASADTLGGLGGCAIGAAVGTQVGGGVGRSIAEAVLCLGGADAGSRIEDGTYGKNRNVESGEVVYLYPGQQSQQYPPGAYIGEGGKCFAPDPASGGHAECWDIMRRYYSSPQNLQPVQQVSYQQSQSPRPPVVEGNLLVNRKASNTSSSAAGPVCGGKRDLSIRTYMETRWFDLEPHDPNNLNKNCRTGNFGHDSICFDKESKRLYAQQDACETGQGLCNPIHGELACYFNNLSKELRSAQDKWRAAGN